MEQEFLFEDEEYEDIENTVEENELEDKEEYLHWDDKQLKLENEYLDTFLNRFTDSENYLYFAKDKIKDENGDESPVEGLWYEYELGLRRRELGHLSGARLRLMNALSERFKTESKPKQVLNKTTGEYETKQYVSKIFCRKKDLKELRGR